MNKNITLLKGDGIGPEIVNQAVKVLGKELRIMARAKDGVVEALYHESHPYLRGYQWHPERLCSFDNDNLRLFEDFVIACKK